MAFIAPVLPYLAVAAAGTQALGAISAGNSEAAAANYQAQVSANNAAIASQNASYALKSGNFNESVQRMKTDAFASSQKARQAANGLNVNTGTPVDVRQGTQTLGELDALTIRNNAAREAYGYQTQGSNFTAQSELDKAAASHDTTAGYINAGSSILGSASSISQKFGIGTSGNNNLFDTDTGDYLGSPSGAGNRGVPF